MMKTKNKNKYVIKEVAFLIVQFLLFMLYFIDLDWMEFSIHVFIKYSLILIMLIGIFTLFFGILNLKENTWFIISTGSKEQTEQIKENNIFLTAGIYQFIRHPIYAGILVVMMSYALLDTSMFKVLVTLTMGLVFFYKSILEEKWLFRKYRNFRLYKQKTGRFFPKISSSS